MVGFRNMTIKKRVFWVIMVVSFVAMVLGSIISMVVSARYQRASLANDLIGLTEMVSDNCLVSLAYNIPDDAKGLLASLKRKPSIKYAVIHNAAGQDFAEYHSVDCSVAKHHLHPETDESSFSEGVSIEKGMMHVWKSIVFDGQQIGSLHLHDDMSSVSTSIRRDALIFSMVLMLVMCIAYAMTIGLHSLISNPLSDLSRVARKISSHGDYGVRAERKTGGEIGTLVDSFNDMLNHIENTNTQLETLIKELEGKNIELERFTYTVSHDLKSPLITIKGFLGQMKKHMKSDEPERVKTDMSRIEDAADKMADLLQDLLELSRVGRVTGEVHAVKFNDIVKSAISMLDGPIRESGVDIQVEEGMPEVEVDTTRFPEVVQNLFENSIKFMGSQEHPRIEIGCRRGEFEDVFYVRDNGIGIEGPYREKVFGLFEQLNQHIPGTGIGLTIVRRIVEIHNGRIWVEDGVDGGVCFCFTIDSIDEDNTKAGTNDAG